MGQPWDVAQLFIQSRRSRKIGLGTQNKTKAHESCLENKKIIWDKGNFTLCLMGHRIWGLDWNVHVERTVQCGWGKLGIFRTGAKDNNLFRCRVNRLGERVY